MNDPNYGLIMRAASILKPILEEFVFVGGCATGLLITDTAAPSIRPTTDVDTLVEIASYARYDDFSQKLRNLGLKEDPSEGAPICRWYFEDLKIDVMPVERSTLGFSNKWYQHTVDAAIGVLLRNGLTIRLIDGPCFLATKLAAFHDRGGGDFIGSHDLEDVVAVIDGRPSLGEEIALADTSLKQFLRDEIHHLLGNPQFMDALPGLLHPDEGNQQRLPLLIDRLRSISNSTSSAGH